MQDLDRSPPDPKPTGKAKGTNKAGCYTCRIRRKKCDEKPDAEGNCQTCVRLRLQCLGFGEKRPDLMHGNNVVELREKIKNFLDSQSQIKDRFSQPSTSGHHGEPSDEDEEDLCADAAVNRSIDSIPDEN